MNAVDTNVFVYALDEDEATKQAKARALLDQLVQPPRSTLLLWQTATELLNVLRRWQAAGHLTADEVIESFRDIRALFPLRLPSPAALDIAFDLHTRFSLSHWDSLLLAACKDAGVDTLFSEDLSDSTDYDGVRIVNPFA